MRSWKALVLVAGLSMGCQSAANVEQEQNALLAVDREWSQTTADPDKFVSYFTGNATIYPPGMPAVAGTDAIRKAYAEMSSAPGFALTWTPAKATVSSGGDIGHTSGTYQSRAGGMTENGKYITVWSKQSDGTWKVTDDIFNADTPPAPPPGQHAMVSPAAIKWGDPPPSLPAGARLAVISGDPSQAQPFVVRLQVPAGYRIAPHWHPTTENVTVLSGTIALGMGETFNEATMTDLGAGGFGSLPAEMRHYFLAKSAATIQVHGMGPFVVNYVNPADDPSKK